MRLRARAVVVVVSVALLASGGCSNASTPPRTDAERSVDLVGKGLTAFGEGRIAAARREYRQALRLDPRSKWAWYNLGVIEHFAGRPARAVPLYRRAIEVDAAYWPALFNLAVIVAPGDRAAALVLYDRVIAAKADFAKAHLNRGFLLLGMDRQVDAMRAFDAATRLDPALTGHLPSDVDVGAG